MTVIRQKDGLEKEYDLDQEIRIALPDSEDMPGNRAWAIDLAEDDDVAGRA